MKKRYATVYVVGCTFVAFKSANIEENIKVHGLIKMQSQHATDQYLSRNKNTSPAVQETPSPIDLTSFKKILTWVIAPKVPRVKFGMKKGMPSFTFFGNAAKKCPISCMQKGDILGRIKTYQKKRPHKKAVKTWCIELIEKVLCFHMASLQVKNN